MKSNWEIWGWPLFMALTSVVGLVTALVGDGVWNFLSWLLLFLPLSAIAIAWQRAAKPSAIGSAAISLQPESGNA